MVSSLRRGSLPPPSSGHAALLIAFLIAVAAGTPGGQAPRRELAVAAVASWPLGTWAGRTERMLHRGTLDFASLQADTMVAGRMHQRLVQRHAGLPVFGGGLVRQVDGVAVRTVFGRLYEDIALDPSPAVPVHEALTNAVRAHGADARVESDPTLGVLPTRAGGYALVWRCRVRTPRDIRLVDVDAHSGAALQDRSLLRRQLPAIGTGTGVGGGRKKVPATPRARRFEAVDQTRPARLETYDFGGSADRLDRFMLTGELFDADLATDDDNVWSDAPVVDAHVQQGWTYDYYFERFGRHGMDDRDGAITTIVHPLSREQADPDGVFVNNAIYVGDRTMLYGDGDLEAFNAFAGALDIVAHEWTHGVQEYSSNLVPFDEPGALSESFSDIMGTAAEFFLQPAGSGPQQADWVIGEDVTKTAPGFIRSLANPAALGHPDHYSLVRHLGTGFDNGGIHLNCGVPNQAFYLAVVGGTNRASGLAVAGVGLENIDRIARIFYRAFVYFLGPTSTFADARAATLQAATELYGPASDERRQVEHAWTAVGVE